MKFNLIIYWKTKSYLIASLLLFSFGFIQAQESTISGTVTGDDGGPLPGVSIVVKGTKVGAVTDFDGLYEINANTNDVLVFSYIGFKTREILVNSGTINVTMESDVSALDEVVLVGYGTQKKKEVTGAVINVGAEVISKTATPDLGTALQGKIAGVNIQAPSGRPGEAANIQIRGIGSINPNSLGPLYVIDGIPFNGVPNIAPEQIESIDVLKDGASAAVYGVQAARGVILITTKTGKAGKMKVNLSTYTGIQNITSGTSLLNTQRQLFTEEVKLQALGRDPLVFSFNPDLFDNDSDFVGDVQNDNAAIRNYNLDVSGGAENLSVSLNTNYFKQEGVLINSGFDRLTSRITGQFQKDKIKIYGTVSFTEENRTQEPFALYEYAIQQRPWNPALADIQSAGQNSVTIPAQNEILFSFLSKELENIDERKVNSSNIALSVEYEILKGLTNKVSLGKNNWNFRRKFFRPQYLVFNRQGDLSPAASREQAILNESFIFNESQSLENILTYKTSFGKHNFNLLGVLSYQKSTSKQLGLGVLFSEGSSNSLQTLGSGAETIAPTSFDDRSTLAGKLIRLQYNYDGKYLLSGSFRRDGTSKFSEENRYGNFFGVSAGWNIHEEGFFNVDAINNLKLRASWAELGNQDIASFATTPTIQTGVNFLFGDNGGQLDFGQIQRSLTNSTILWETSISKNIGLDLAMFNNRLNFTADYYENGQEDLLLPERLSPSVGTFQTRAVNQFSTVLVNAGNMTNKGLELALNYSDQTSYGLKYSIGSTFTKNKNEVTDLNGVSRGFANGRPIVSRGDETDFTTFLAEGYEAGAFFLLQNDGIIKTQEELDAYRLIDGSAQLGDVRFIDENEDNRLDDTDRVYAGSGQADFEAGLNLNLEYKNFDFYVQAFYSYGAEIYNGAKLFAYASGRHSDLYYAWSPQNPNSDIAPHRDSFTHNNIRARSDLFLEDGTYLRIRNLSLGYTIPTAGTGIEKARVYLSAVNPFTFTKYEGYDPEVGGDGLFTRGVDVGNYPVTRQIQLGFELSF